MTTAPAAFVTTRHQCFEPLPSFDAFAFEVGSRADGTMVDGYYDAAFWGGAKRPTFGKANPAVGWISPAIRAELARKSRAWMNDLR